MHSLQYSIPLHDIESLGGFYILERNIDGMYTLNSQSSKGSVDTRDLIKPMPNGFDS